MTSLQDDALGFGFLTQGVHTGEGGRVALGAGGPGLVDSLALHIALRHEVTDHDRDAAPRLVLVLSPSATWEKIRASFNRAGKICQNKLTHFVRLGPGQLGEVAKVGFVLDDGVAVDDGGRDVSLRSEPELDNLLQALLNMVRGQLELDNILGELKIYISGKQKLYNFEAHLLYVPVIDGFPDRVNAAGALALGGPQLGEVGKLLVPGDLPHVGRGGDALTGQRSIGDLTTIPGIEKRVMGRK